MQGVAGESTLVGYWTMASIASSSLRSLAFLLVVALQCLFCFLLQLAQALGVFQLEADGQRLLA
jgi:hypothetical protein